MTSFKKNYLIIIPTYNEKNNIYFILNKISKCIKFKHDILFVDDNSNDGTLDLIKNINSKKIFLLKRKKKLGIGSAHKDGIKYGYKNKYRYIITMDCDGTHDPKYINKMLKLVNTEDLIITNRFGVKNSLSEWNILRKIITSFRYFLVAFLFNTKLDSSGAYRLYNCKRIRLKDILLAKNDGYIFFTESTIIINKIYKVSQIPVLLPKRYAGSSKMTFTNIIFGFFNIFYIYLRIHLFNQK